MNMIEIKCNNCKTKSVTFLRIAGRADHVMVFANQIYKGQSEYWFTIGSYKSLKNAKRGAVRAMRDHGYTFDPDELEKLNFADMEKKEVEAVAKQMIEERVKAASNAMDSMKQLKEAYVDLRKKGFHEGANAMRDMVYMFLIQKPNATELDVILMLAEKCGIDVDSKKQK